MQMTMEQQLKIREDHDVWANSACDECGRVLAAIRYTRKGELGEWCTARCRDGEVVTMRIERKRQDKINLKNTRLRIVQARTGRQLSRSA
jgi:hypothetical protein